jgi:capsid protein
MIKDFLNRIKSSLGFGLGRPDQLRLANGGYWGMRPQIGNYAQPLDKNINVGEWRTIVNASQKLFWNFGPAQGALQEKSTYVVGRSWLPRFEGEDKEWGRIATEWLIGQFYGVSHVNGMDFQTALYLDSLSVDRDGDVFCLYTESRDGYPQFQQIPWHAVGARDLDDVVKEGPYRGLRMHNGVILNEYGRPVAFRILGRTPAEDRDISARNMDFIREPVAPDQTRGLPAFTSAILDLRDLMTMQDYVRQAAKLAAAIGLIEHNEAGMADMADPAYALQRTGPSQQGIVGEEIFGGTVRYFRANSGAKLEQLKSEVPSEATNSLMERLLRNALHGAGLPYEFFWDASKLGGASVRAMVAKVNRTVADRQDLIRPAAKRRVGYAVSKAIKLGILPQYRGADLGGSLKWSFTTPPQVTVDAGYANADAREAYKLGMRTLTEILAEGGRTLTDHLDEREREEVEIRTRMERSGLPESAFRVIPGVTLQQMPESTIPT